VCRAELGEIRRQMAGSTVNDVEEEIEQAAKLFPDALPKILGKSTAGIAYLRGAVQRALRELERKGTVSEDTCLYLERVFGKKPGNPATFLRLWFLGEMPEGYEEDFDSDGKQGRRRSRANPTRK